MSKIVADGFADAQAHVQFQKDQVQLNIAQEMADDLLALLNEWHSLPEVWDNELDAQIHKWYSNPPKLFPKKPYFSPSSAGSDPRELYMKGKGAKKDVERKPPHQGRWTRLGTAIGDVIQRDILFIEKHGEDKLGTAPRFRWVRDDKGRPMFEDFAKANVPVKYRDKLFYLFGAPDGIMEYITDDGEVIRVGLEIKSKQTTFAQTGDFSMRGPEAKHVEQCCVYSMMYNVDYYIVMYVNASKKGWFMNEADVEKYPDIRTFGVSFSESDRLRVLDKFVDVLEAIDKDEPPTLDLSNWTFNSFKESIALSLTKDEMVELKEQVKRAKASSMKPYLIRGIEDAYFTILDIRDSAGGNV